MFWLEPRAAGSYFEHKYREKIELGELGMDGDAFAAAMRKLEAEWCGIDYSLLGKVRASTHTHTAAHRRPPPAGLPRPAAEPRPRPQNCNHFSGAVCAAIGKPMPPYPNRLVRLGTVLIGVAKAA